MPQVVSDSAASPTALDTVSPLGRTREADASAMDEAFRTRSLPAWVRNKTRPLTTLDDLNTIYEKVSCALQLDGLGSIRSFCFETDLYVTYELFFVMSEYDTFAVVMIAAFM